MLSALWLSSELGPEAPRDGTRQNAERICGADQNCDNLRINRAYLRISDYCSVAVRARVRITVKIRVRVRLGLGLRIVLYKLLEKVTKCGLVT